MISSRLLLLSSAWMSVVRGFSLQRGFRSIHPTTRLEMVRTRGLEVRREGATPTEGGMALYIKAAEDGTSVGDCPFGHAVRLVLEEKGLDYEIKPCTPDTKPNWLNEFYEGKMPALRHRKECYVESGIIAEYLEFFFPDPSLKVTDKTADDLLEGFFPVVAKYLKSDDADVDAETLEVLRSKLTALETHLESREYLCGDAVTLADCRWIPQLYHLLTGIDGFKGGIPNVVEEFPNVRTYYERASSRPSFQSTVYPEETVLWGWGNARKNK